ncbi:hypothetical protein X777_13329 [Ooceraea biroi]|uniref:Uncharacterized protein n=1 Tax=Ooceraea biroi TaxID=2015173 RepID=A0A026WWY9_OOCBI|nr:hypothetical protein X777_13329 [Ooceraea biroi]
MMLVVQVVDRGVQQRCGTAWRGQFHRGSKNNFAPRSRLNRRRPRTKTRTWNTSRRGNAIRIRHVAVLFRRRERERSRSVEEDDAQGREAPPGESRSHPRSGHRDRSSTT